MAEPRTIYVSFLPSSLLLISCGGGGRHSRFCAWYFRFCAREFTLLKNPDTLWVVAIFSYLP